jgi:hypothetical protein
MWLAVLVLIAVAGVLFFLLRRHYRFPGTSAAPSEVVIGPERSRSNTERPIGLALLDAAGWYV